MSPISKYFSSITSDEWTNFLERVKCNNEEELKGSDELEEELRLWASYRGQTLTRTGILFVCLFLCFCTRTTLVRIVFIIVICLATN